MKRYFPTRYIDVNASLPHPPNTKYRVSRGTESWGDRGELPRSVMKVQMVYDGRVSGRRSPSYPHGTSDAVEVVLAMQEIAKGHGRLTRGKTA